MMLQQNIRRSPVFKEASDFMPPRTLRIEVAFLF
jgi:hypothetical protein